MSSRKTLRSIAFTTFISLSIISCGGGGNFTPEKPQTDSLDADTAAMEFGDVVRSPGNDYLDDPALTAVTRAYGPSVIKSNLFPHSDPVSSDLATATVKPWSSWWFPKVSNYLFTDTGPSPSSPLTKYDMFRSSKTGHPSHAAAFESQHYNANALPWEGLCDAWAIAAVDSPEPKHSVTVSVQQGWSKINITFSVGDLKALLLKTYEAVDDTSLKFYGQKFTGDERGWIYPDIFPEQLHRFVEVQLFQNKQAFVMDHDPGVEVWNVPVYKANYVMSAIPDQPNAIFVKLWLYSAESTQENEKDFVGIKEATREYDYVLEGSKNAAGDFTVASGYWVKGPDGIDSRKDHPDYVVQLPQTKLVRKSWNPEIDISLVDELLTQSYQ